MVIRFQGEHAMTERQPGINHTVFYDLALGVTQCHFCHILLIKEVTKAYLSSRGKEIDFIS